MIIKHISFDLWLTLIKSHPLFKMKRAELIIEKYCDQELTAKEIDVLIRKVDKQIDNENESTGRKMPARQMYFTILQQICFRDNNTLLTDAAMLEIESNELFIQYCPVFLNDNIIEMLSSLHNEGYTLNLASNTGFIEGNTLRIVLNKLGILQYFSFLVFSDEVKVSKPFLPFFQEIYSRLNMSKREILHVGDNELTDYKGATDFGFNACLITNSNYTIDDIKKRL